MRIAHLGLGILLFMPAGVMHAQSTGGQTDTDPLAAAAKRTREDKKDATKPVRVWDNDTIPKSGQNISVVGQTSDAAVDGSSAVGTDGANNSTGVATAATGSAGAAPTAPSGAAGGGANSSSDGAYLQARIASGKEKLASLRTDLDLMQRTLALDSQMYYSKPDYSNDRAGAQKLADEQAQIASKQQAIDEQEKEIADLQALAKGAPQTSQNNDGAKDN